MVDDPRPPVAIRMTRPYTTEDEFLERELETLTRTSVTLLGAQPRPQGVVLRFELVLSSGYVLMRGEGRVVGFRPNVHQGLGGLTLRFTRLDSRSKALVDKATALRERRRPSALPAALSEGTPAPSPAPHVDVTQPLAPSAALQPDLPPDSGSAHDRPGLDLGSTQAEASISKRTEHAPEGGSRDALLDRLRTRAKALDGAAVQRILEQRKRRAT
jgi:hypothetical protein